MPEQIIDIPTFEDLKTAMGEDFIGELIDTYLDETPQLIAELQQALARADDDTFRRSAHSIKSSSAAFGAHSFSAQARELELMGKHGTLEGAAPKVACLVADYGNVERRLRELRNGS
jgi:HPt (histidine-containing phosphotransfer) domain-containing protein